MSCPLSPSPSPEPTRADLPDEIGAAMKAFESAVSDDRRHDSRYYEGGNIDDCRAALTEAILARLTAAEAKRDALRVENTSLRGLMADNMVIEVVEDDEQGRELLAGIVAVTEARDEALARVERMEKALRSAITICDHMQLTTDHYIARCASDASEKMRAVLAHPATAEET